MRCGGARPRAARARRAAPRRMRCGGDASRSARAAEGAINTEFPYMCVLYRGSAVAVLVAHSSDRFSAQHTALCAIAVS
jgi:hypothetical protein